MSKILYNKPNLAKFIQKIEDQNFEKKSALIQSKALVNEFSAFANSSVDGGLVVVGIKKDTTPEGINFLNQTGINNLIKAQRIHCPLAKVEHKIFDIKNNKGKADKLLLFFVDFSPDKVIKTVAGEAYERIADETCKMSISKIKQMEYDKGEADFEQELVNGVTISDLNEKLLDSFIKEWSKRDGLSSKPSIEDLIIIKNFGRKEGDILKINYAGVLLFHNEPHKFISGANIRFLKYEGDKIETGERSNIVKDKFFEGPITMQIDSAAKMIISQIKEFSFLDDKGKFKIVLEYPKFAWYEAIVNAVTHRAYDLKNANIFIRMFNNRIEVTSPGNLPGPVTVQNIYKQHFPRNPFLMQGLLSLGYVKSASEGMDRIKEEMQILGLPEPKLINDKEGVIFSINLFNNIENRRLRSESEELQKINHAVFRELNATQKKIVQFIAQNKKVQTGDVVKTLEIPRPTITMNLGILEKGGYINRVGAQKGPKVKYVLSEKILKIEQDVGLTKEPNNKPKQGKLL